MDALTPFQKLDICLANIHQEEDYNSIFRRIEDLFLSDLQPGEIDCMLDKLHQDGYTDHVAGQHLTDLRASNGLNIRKNYHGELFTITEGGYEGGYKRKKQEAIQVAAYNDRMENHTRRLAEWTERLTYSTVVAAVGAFGLLLWEMRHFFRHLFSSS